MGNINYPYIIKSVNTNSKLVFAEETSFLSTYRT